HNNSEEEAHKHARQQSAKLSQEIRQNYKTTFRTSVEVTDTASRRHVLQNSTDRLVNYELRRKMRRVGVQLQHVGTQLCWQIYIDDPGTSLGVGELLHVGEPDNLGLGSMTPPEAPVILLEITQNYWMNYDS